MVEYRIIHSKKLFSKKGRDNNCLVEYLNSFSLKKTNKKWQDTLRYFCIKPQATKKKKTNSSNAS